MEKILTIVVPVYNVEKYINKCLDSLVLDDSELMSLYEVIIVNDGSPDRSAELSREYVKRYPGTFRQIDKVNGNYGSCVNVALKEATGKYFRMLDADDWANQQALADWLIKLRECDADMVITEAEDRYVDGTLLQHMTISESIVEGQIYAVEDFDAAKLGFKHLYCSHIVTYRTELLREIGLKLQEGISYTDNEYVFFPLDHIKSVVCYRLPFYQYLVGREGQTTSDAVMQKSVRQMYQVLDGLLDYYVTHLDSQIPSVANNQRLVLSKMIFWVYCLCFTREADGSMKSMVADIEHKIANDKALLEMTSSAGIKYGISLLTYYRKKGWFVDNPIVKANIYVHRVFRKAARVLHILK